MNFISRLPVVAFVAAGLLLTACGQKGALTLPDSNSATPIVIREAQPASAANAPAPATAPNTVPAPAAPQGTAPASPTPPQR